MDGEKEGAIGSSCERAAGVIVFFLGRPTAVSVTLSRFCPGEVALFFLPTRTLSTCLLSSDRQYACVFVKHDVHRYRKPAESWCLLQSQETHDFKHQSRAALHGWTWSNCITYECQMKWHHVTVMVRADLGLPQGSVNGRLRKGKGGRRYKNVI